MLLSHGISPVTWLASPSPSFSVSTLSVTSSSPTDLPVSSSDLTESNSYCPKAMLFGEQSDPDATFYIVFHFIPNLSGVEFGAKPQKSTNKIRTCQATQAFKIHLNREKNLKIK